jgi:hypothetical protein
MVHIVGTWMIVQGTDGLSRVDMMTGVMGGLNILSGMTLGFSDVERLSSLEEWVKSWWSDGRSK